MSYMNVVRQLRERAGLTQELLARASGVSPSAISRLERGVVSPTLDTLSRLAEPANLEVVVTFRPRSQEANGSRRDEDRLDRGSVGNL